MTRRERAQVVELLRCAADDVALSGGLALMVIYAMDDASTDSYLLDALAWAAMTDANDGWSIGCSPDPVATMLEAAQRVEEGTWP